MALGLVGRGVDDAFDVPEHTLHLIGNDVVLEVASQFGTNYTLIRDFDLSSAAPLFTVPGTGQTLFLTDPNAANLFTRAFYRVEAMRN